VRRAEGSDENCRVWEETPGKIDKFHPNELAAKVKYEVILLHGRLGYNLV
jgi:hypothetical protein